MELYDLIFLALLVVLGFWGFISGALRQIVNFASFFLAVYLAVSARSFMTNAFNLDEVTSYLAVFVLFVALFVGIRLFGGAIADGVHKQRALGSLDRLLGAGMGIVWTLLIAGLFHLIFAHLTPIGNQPKWFTDAKVYPLSAQSAKTIQALLPDGANAAETVADDV